MVVILNEGFEDGVATNTLTTSNTRFSTIVGSPTFQSAGAFRGGLAMHTTSVASAARYGERTFTAGGTLWARTSLYMPATPGDRQYIMTVLSGVTVMAQLRIDTDNTMRARNRTTAIGSQSTTALSLNTHYQILWRIDSSAAQQQYWIYDASGTLLYNSGNLTYTTGTFDRIQIGTTTAMVNYNTYFDNIVVDTTKNPGVLVSGSNPPLVRDVQHASASLTATLTITKPTGTVSGNLLIANVGTTVSTSFTTPSGWTPIFSLDGAAAFWKIAGGSEPANYSFVNGSALGNPNGSIIRITGHDPTTPIVASAGLAMAARASSVLPSVNVSGSDRLLLQMLRIANTGVTSTEPAEASEFYDTSGSYAGGYDTATVGAGATGTRTWTHSGTNSTSGLIAAIAPPAAATPEANGWGVAA